MFQRFFGLVRQSCGGNSHPEPRVFAQLFRLLSVYSLVKPIRGSNITGGEMVTTLLNLEDLNSELMEIVEHDHSYIGEGVDEFALSYVGGFVARLASDMLINLLRQLLLIYHRYLKYFAFHSKSGFPSDNSSRLFINVE